MHGEDMLDAHNDAIEARAIRDEIAVLRARVSELESALDSFIDVASSVAWDTANGRWGPQATRTSIEARCENKLREALHRKARTDR